MKTSKQKERLEQVLKRRAHEPVHAAGHISPRFAKALGIPEERELKRMEKQKEIWEE